MSTAQHTALGWERDPQTWKYHATDAEGDRWHIIQATSSRWEVYRNGSLVFDWPHTLADAKWHAEEEADPAARARREVRRAELAERRARRPA